MRKGFYYFRSNDRNGKGGLPRVNTVSKVHRQMPWPMSLFTERLNLSELEKNVDIITVP
jgi:hypothetical protein